MLSRENVQHVMASSAEAEAAVIVHNAQIALVIWYMLHHLGHPQPTTPLHTDNQTGSNFIYDSITQKKQNHGT